MENQKKLKSNFIWNMIGTTFNAFNSLFFLIIVTRINGINEAGIFTIAFSTACILYVIGMYAGRVFQVTESDKNVNDKEYIVNRIISCVIMMIITLLLLIIKRYDMHKSTIFIILAGYKCLEAFSDVLYGIMQKNDELNMVGKSYFIKGIISLSLFILIDIITKNLVASCVSIVFVWILAILIYDFTRIKRFNVFKSKINMSNVIKIFKGGFFIFAITFLGLYMINASKYSIDRYLTEDIQAIYGIIIMPATVMGLIGQVLIHPYLNSIMEFVNEKNFDRLKKLINKVVICLAGTGLLASICAYILGIPVLSLVYGVDLSGYEILLTVIIIASTVYNIGIIYSSVLTAIRHTIIQFIIYVIASILALITANILTLKYNITGAVWSYFITMFVFFALYIISINYILEKMKKENKKEKIDSTEMEINMESMVSIIIPVYNSEDYIIRCLDSIKGQTYKNIEIVVINDGSKDKSGELILKYKNENNDLNINYIENENQGVAKTRNEGIKIASGKYIMFIDNDDYIDRDYVETFVKNAEATNSDIVIGGYKRTNNDGKILKVEKLKNAKWSRLIIMAPWAKIYKKEYLIENKFEFLSNNIGEDNYFNLQAMMMSDNIKIIDYIGYNWFFNEKSVSNTTQKNLKKINVMYLLDKCYDELKVKKILERENDLIEYYFYRYIIWFLLFTTKKAKKEEIYEVYKNLKIWMKERFPKYEKNKYIGLFKLEGESFNLKITIKIFSIFQKLRLDRIFLNLYSKL